MDGDGKCATLHRSSRDMAYHVAAVVTRPICQRNRPAAILRLNPAPKNSAKNKRSGIFVDVDPADDATGVAISQPAHAAPWRERPLSRSPAWWEADPISGRSEFTPRPMSWHLGRVKWTIMTSIYKVLAVE